MKKSFFSLFLAFLLTVFSFTSAFAMSETESTASSDEQKSTQTSNDQPDVTAEAAILIDAVTGEILYEKNAYETMYPASITKLMTVLLALENGSLSDELTMSHEAGFSIEYGSSHIALDEGEVITLEQALYAIMLQSANEASNAVAEYVDGSIEAFAAHMTERAKELGCQNTHFTNANGLHDENHYTTAYDMALIMKELLKHEEFRTIAKETYYEIPPTNLQSETRYLHGQHQMMRSNSAYYREDVIAGKTGFTNEALNTLVTAASEGDTTLIAVTLGCTGANHYTDTAALFDYGFANFKTMLAATAASVATQIPVLETYEDKTEEKGVISAMPAEDIYITVPFDTDASAVTTQILKEDSLSTPVEQGAVVGTVSVLLNGQTVKTVDLLSTQSIAATTAEERAAMEEAARNALLKKIGIIAGSVLLSFCILLCITRTIGKMRREKRRKARKMARKRRLQNHNHSHNKHI